MGILVHLTNLFSRAGRDDNRLKQAMDHAHAKHPEKAIPLYDSLLKDDKARPALRARVLFNRALAHSSMKDDQKAIADLENVVSMPGAPENVLSAARNQLVRVRNRVKRVRDHAASRSA
jgi:hypothetical protein